MRERIGEIRLRDQSAAMAQIIASNIRALRVAHDETQDEFAERVGVSQGTVARWERGSKPKYDAMNRLAELAGVTVQEFTTKLLKQPQLPDLGSTTSTVASIMLPVTLPNEEALTAMFHGLLRVLKDEPDQAVVARRLAQLLPNALARSVFLSSDDALDLDGAAPLASGDEPPAAASPAPKQRPHIR